MPDRLSRSTGDLVLSLVWRNRLPCFASPRVLKMSAQKPLEPVPAKSMISQAPSRREPRDKREGYTYTAPPSLLSPASVEEMLSYCAN